MAALAVQSVSEEIKTVTSENGIVETSSKTDNETLVALSSKNVEASIAKFSSDDSGILCKNDSETSSSASVKSIELDAEESKQSQDQKTAEDKSSQERETNDCSQKSSQISSNRDSDSSPKKILDEDSNSSFNSTVRRSQSVNNDDENSCSSVRSASTVKTSQLSTHKSDDESNHASSSRCSTRSSPQKSTQNTTSFKSSQSARSDLTEGSNSRSSIRRSVSKSPTKTSQSVSYKSDDDTSRSSFRSSRKSTPNKHTQSVATNLTEDDDSRSSYKSSSSRSTVKISQLKTDNHDDQNSRSSFTSSSNKNKPQKSNDEKENKKKRYFSIVDSDSEEETTIIEKTIVDDENNQPPEAASNSKTKNIRKLIDSDSDEEIITVNKTSNKDENDSDNDKENVKVTKKPNKISNIIDSESDSDREAGSENGSEKENSKTVQKSNKLSLLIDSDSESDRDQRAENYHQDHSDNEKDTSNAKKGKKKSEKKRTGSTRASKDLAMQQIHSETQRLIRESHVSLPYHRPKQRTLEEFLNRKKTPSNLPKNFTNAERIKMFPEIISKVVKEKEKEAEDFYQSSDSEEDDKHDKTMEIEDASDDKKVEKDIQDMEHFDSMQIFCTQKLTQDDIQESHNKKELLLQRSVDFGATRKLFVDDTVDMKESEETQTTEKHLNSEKSILSEAVDISKDTGNESRVESKDSSVSRKLFTDNVESMDVDENTENHDATMSEKSNEGEEENGNKKTDSPKKTTELENSCEDIVLNMSETEHDSSAGKKIDESNEITDKDVLAVEELSVISETSTISRKDVTNTGESSTASGNDNTGNTSTENAENSTSDPILKVAPGVIDVDEIIDKNMLRSDYFRPLGFEKSTKELSIKEKILTSASKLKPMIKSSPGCMIDLTSAGPIREGASKLMDRFLSRHTPTNKPTAEKVSEVKILRTERVGDDVKIIEEILPFKIAAEEGRREKKSGERFKLKETLMLQIANARDEEWKHKEEDEDEEEEEESKCRGDDFYEGLPDEEEVLEDKESAESEPEEDDMPIVEKPRRKCDFGDEEAEESEVDADEENEAEEEDENEEEEKEDSEEEDEEETESEKEEIPDKPKKLRRIISAFDDDSNQSKSSVSNDASKKQTLERAKTDEDMFATQVSNDYPNPEAEAESMQPFQFRERCDSDSRSQACKTPLPKSNNILSMISPVAQLTALNTSLESAKKSASKTNNFDLGRISSQNTPTENSDRVQSNCNVEKMVGLQKKLFEDPPDSVNEDELLAICSGKFTDTQSSGAPAMSTQNGVTDSQLMDICSGAFDTPASSEKKTDEPATNNGVTDSQLMDILSGAFNTPSAEEKRTDDTVLVGDETSQDITLAIEDDEESKGSPAKRSSSLKRSDESMFSSDSSKMSKSSTGDKETFKNPMEAWLKRANTKPTQPKTQPKGNEVTDSQLIGLCSGDFTSQPVDMKKLEAKGNEVTDSQLMGLCSGDFTSQPVDMKKLEAKDNQVTDSQLMGLCSGAFTSQPVDMKKLEGSAETANHDEVSQDFQLTLDDNSNDSLKDGAVNSKDKQTVPSIKKVEEEQPKAPRAGLRIASSSEDEDVSKEKKEKPKKKVFRKKKVAKLQLSDDEDEGPKEYSDEEESEIEEDDEEKFVDYDSEENEVVVVPKKEIKKVARKFLENEAELSESDWDSDDEDERGLDRLEFEEGDAEDIDEDKMKDELDRIHMKQVMDEDQRDVRMLQELLFDDGDLHSEGAGRERKFKWKNIDSMGTDELEPRADEDPEVIDDEVDTAVELQMRKMRYEQMKFQEEREQSMSNVLDDGFGDDLSKAGLKVVSVRSNKKSVGEQVLNKAKSIDNPSNMVTKSTLNFTKKSLTTSFSFSNMRGSFLARGEETLVRIAQHLPEKTSYSVSSARNKKFVFEHLSPSVSNAQKDDSENDNTPAKDKTGNGRKRKIFSSQTPRSTKKMKVDERAAGKKLF